MAVAWKRLFGEARQAGELAGVDDASFPDGKGAEAFWHTTEGGVLVACAVTVVWRLLCRLCPSTDGLPLFCVFFSSCLVLVACLFSIK
jgi:hypothetical protein